VRITIPPGTQSGRVFRLRKEGVPYLKRRGRGDQLVKIIVKIPENISAHEKKVIEELTSKSSDTDSPPLLHVRDFEN
jgi:molecular chaperone DnaJ